MVGKTPEHHQIVNQIGKGGMGEVYQAKGPEAQLLACSQIAPGKDALSGAQHSGGKRQ